VAHDRAERFRSVTHLAAALRPFAQPTPGGSGIRPVPVLVPPSSERGGSSSERRGSCSERRGPPRLLLGATFLLGAGIASGLHTLDVDLGTGARLLRHAPAAILARADGFYRTSLEEYARLREYALFREYALDTPELESSLSTR
jgi:hypothetical protein